MMGEANEHLRKLRRDIDAILEDDDLIVSMGGRSKLGEITKQGLLSAAASLDRRISHVTNQ